MSAVELATQIKSDLVRKAKANRKERTAKLVAKQFATDLLVLQVAREFGL